MSFFLHSPEISQSQDDLLKLLVVLFEFIYKKNNITIINKPKNKKVKFSRHIIPGGNWLSAFQQSEWGPLRAASLRFQPHALLLPPRIEP